MWVSWSGGEIDRDDLIRLLTYTDVEGVPPADLEMLPEAVATEYAYLAGYNQAGLLGKKELEKARETLRNLMSITPNELRKYEDIHSLIEHRLSEEIDFPYICRSRNETVNVVERLYLRRIWSQTLSSLYWVVDTLEYERNRVAKRIPVYTHYRRADSVIDHSLYDSYLETLDRILRELRLFTDLLMTSPMGSGPIAGCISGEMDIVWRHASMMLGFRHSHRTTLDAVNSRKEHIRRHLYLASRLLGLYTRMARDIYLLEDEGFFRLSEEAHTGSSALPHKENPDLMEILEAKRLYAASSSAAASALESDMTGYQRTSQEFKHMVVKTSLDLILSTKAIFENLLTSIATPYEDYTIYPHWIATRLSIKMGIPYREAYHMVKERLISGEEPLDLLDERFSYQDGPTGYVTWGGDDVRRISPRTIQRLLSPTTRRILKNMGIL